MLDSAVNAKESWALDSAGVSSSRDFRACGVLHPLSSLESSLKKQLLLPPRHPVTPQVLLTHRVYLLVIKDLSNFICLVCL